MNSVLKSISIEENGITYTYFDAKRTEFFYVDSQHAVVFQREFTKMFILDVECKNIDEFNNMMITFFTCDGIKVNAK